MAEPELFREILGRVLARYLTVKPEGILIDDRPLDQVIARVLSFGAARTLYRGRRPACRSLDGRKAPQKETLCASCPDRKHCTPQVRVDLTLDHRPYRLLLAFSSARNFLVYASEVKKTGASVEDVNTRIRVLNRGSWGELRFTSTSANRP
jgi:hypothetical protein